MLLTTREMEIMKEYLLWIRWEVEPFNLNDGFTMDEEYMWVDANTQEEALEKAKASWGYPYDLMSVVDEEPPATAIDMQ